MLIVIVCEINEKRIRHSGNHIPSTKGQRPMEICTRHAPHTHVAAILDCPLYVAHLHIAYIAYEPYIMLRPPAPQLFVVIQDPHHFASRHSTSLTLPHHITSCNLAAMNMKSGTHIQHIILRRPHRPSMCCPPHRLNS